MSRFITLVADMRDAQAEYFRRRDQGSLVKAKSIEQLVDQALREMVQRRVSPDGQQLFEGYELKPSSEQQIGALRR